MARIAIVVEGDGDKQAVPVLVRRHLEARERFDVEVGRPLNTKGRSKLLRPGELERYVRLACFQPGTTGVLVVCDTDADAACELGPAGTLRANAGAAVPVRFCLAVRKFENWIAASAETLANETLEVPDFEAINGENVVRRWRAPQKYVKPLHQARYTNGIDHELVAERCPSFARLLRCIDELIA